MALTNDQITAQNFKDFYGQIRPYLNGQVPTFANQFSRSDLYSTSEKIIGQWIDGKPIYQKIIELQNTFTFTRVDSWTNVCDLPNAKTIVNIDCYYDDSIRTPNALFVALNDKLCYYWDETLSLYDCNKIKIAYTKSTDSAIKVGTGTDYSTDEQIIGTWIDGKPLYQKSYTGTCNATSLVVDANMTDSYIDSLISMNGTCSAMSPTYNKHNWSNTYYQDSNDSYRVSIHPSNGLMIDAGGNNPKRPFTYIITIRYTKTTD